MSDRYTPEQEEVLLKIEKLLNLAAKNPNENEAALAAAKAQELLARYNLSTAALERASGGSGKRAQEEVEGGFYRYQRELWREVAELNFCRHWVQKKWVAPEERVRNVKFKRRHVLIGRQVNVRTTINLSNYLLSAIERVAREVCEEKRIGHLSGWAMSFREGCAYRLTEKLQARRKELIDEEERKEREAWERAKKAGVSHSTSLTITSFVQNEEDANEDFRRGVPEGTTARERTEWNAERAERYAKAAEERRRQEEEYTRWAAENPEAAKAKREAEEKAAAKRARRWSGSYRERRDTRYDHVDRQAFWAGAKKGDEIGLDPQASDKNRSAGRIR